MTTLNSELLIDSKILRENISYIKSKLKNQTNFMSVIKSDAYGHNLEFIIKDIDDISDGYGVVRIEEAIKIRKFSDKKILLMQGVYTDADYQLAKENNLDLVVHNNDQFSLIRKHNNFNNLWLKVNTGMNRLGLDSNDLDHVLDNISYISSVNFEFILTHFSNSNNKDDNFNYIQYEKILKLSSYFKKRKISLSNTGGILLDKKFILDQTRPGIGIYGYDANGKNIILYVWYDNEFGYTKQVIRLAKYVSGVRRLHYYWIKRYFNFSTT